MVIVILGILAATALPRFIDLGREARIAVMTSLMGSMRSANSMLYAKAAAAGKNLSGSDSVTVNGQVINLSMGFAANLTQLLLVLDVDTGKDFGTSETSTNLLFYKNAESPYQCSMHYEPPNPWFSSQPRYDLKITGC